MNITCRHHLHGVLVDGDNQTCRKEGDTLKSSFDMEVYLRKDDYTKTFKLIMLKVTRKHLLMACYSQDWSGYTMYTIQTWLIRTGIMMHSNY